MQTYQLILYRKKESGWHYVRLTAAADGLLRTEQGQCGFSPTEVETLQVAPGSNPEALVRKAGEVWGVLGYGPVNAIDFPVMTLHFKMPRWRGLQPAAPWFDEWVRFYYDPIREAFERTGNGRLRGEERFSGNYLLYYTVFDPALAHQAVALVAAASPEPFDLEISISERGKTVYIPIDPEVPDFLQDFLRGFEHTARAISNGLSSVPSTDPMKPELVKNRQDQRISGDEAREVFHTLKQKWRFEYAIWEPANSGLPLATTHFPEIQQARQKQLLTQALLEHAIPDIYFLDFENGLFRAEPEMLFNDVWEGLVFDRTFEWFLYSTNYYTVNIGGDMLVKELSGSAMVNSNNA